MLAKLMKKKYEERIEEETKKPGTYVPDQDSFEAFIEYMFANPGKNLTYREFIKFKKEKENNQ